MRLVLLLEVKPVYPAITFTHLSSLGSLSFPSKHSLQWMIPFVHLSVTPLISFLSNIHFSE